MTRNFTANGTFIPQDAAGNDMCILFMKYGRCRFRAKCKKSHWVPPLPDDPYPVEIKPPLPNDELKVCTEDETRNIEYTPDSAQKEPLQNMSPMPISITSAQSTSCNRGSDVPKFKKANSTTENVGVNRLFIEAGAYFDNVAQKVQISKPPQNKIEKRQLKVLRKIHWQNTQTLKQKLSRYPPSYNLKFDWSKIDLVRLRPYVYVLVHECMCVDGEMKPSKPSSFEYLVADTLMAYLDGARMKPQDAEEKLRRWGGRAVRARQCVDHLWHVLAISSNSPDGCAKDVVRIEDEVTKGSRSSLDYAHACAFALKRVELRRTANKNLHVPRKVSSSVKQGIDAQQAKKTKFTATRMKRGSLNMDAFGRVIERAKYSEEHVTNISEHGNETIENAGKVTVEHARKINEDETDAQKHIVEETQRTEKKTKTVTHAKDWIAHGKVAHDEPKRDSAQRAKRKRSKQFKNVPFSERKRFKTRCLKLLTG